MSGKIGKSGLLAHRLIFHAIVVLAVLVCYTSSIQGKFLWDDNFIIRDNVFLRKFTFQNIYKIFTTDYGAGAGTTYYFYRPFENFSHLIEYSLWHTNPFGYHLTSIFLHIFVVYAFYFLVFEVSGSHTVSKISSLLYAVHPIHTETVSYVSCRSNLLVTLFLVLASVFYIRMVKNNHVSISGYAATMLFFLFAVFSKETGFIFPALVLVYHRCFTVKLQPRLFAPMLFISVAYIGGRYLTIREAIGHFSPVSSLEKIPGFFESIVQYFRLLIVPLNQHADYGVKIFRIYHPGVWMGILVCLILCILAIKARRKKPLITFGIFWFFVSLLPTSNIHASAFKINFYMSEHWLYMPSMGIFLIFGYAYKKYIISRWNRWGWYAWGFAIAVYGLFTFRQNLYWSDPLIFYRRETTLNPDSINMTYNLANEYRNRREYQNAVIWYQRAISLDPGKSINSYINLAGVYREIGQASDSAKMLRKALEYAPSSAEIYYNLAMVLYEAGHREQAIYAYEQVIRLQPNNADGYNNLGVIYSDLGDKMKKIEYFSKAIQADPDNPNGYLNLSYSYAQEKRYGQAMEMYQKAESLGASNGTIYDLIRQGMKNNEGER